MTSNGDLADQLAVETARLDAELKEIDLLVNQARNEAARHETRRATAAEKLAGLPASTSAREAIDLANQAVTLTRRSALMDAQVEILDAKRKAIVRLKDWLVDHAARLRALAEDATGEGGTEGTDGDGHTRRAGGGRRGKTARAGSDEAVVVAPEALPTAATPAMSRIIVTAQEDLRREIARAMHDGPAQSLTNIVLQAEIAERLVGRDPVAAKAEVRQLVAMVQQTLEATKSFIFDVRPMVLDDLGLVPTLRRAARDRGRRAGIAVEFESLGIDLRLPAELESGLFRILDEALAGYLAARPERVTLRLDWGEVLEVHLSAHRTPMAVPPPELPAAGESLPPALAAMVEERRADHAGAVEAAERASVVQLPANLERDLDGRATSLGISAELLDRGGHLRLVAPLPRTDAAAAAAGHGASPEGG